MQGENKDPRSYLFRYGLLTPAIFGVSHLMYRTHALINPNTATIKHILAELVKFRFRRLVIYAPVKRNYLAVSNLYPARACLIVGFQMTSLRFKLQKLVILPRFYFYDV